MDSAMNIKVGAHFSHGGLQAESANCYLEYQFEEECLDSACYMVFILAVYRWVWLKCQRPFALRTSGNISGVRRKRSIERAYRAVLSIVFTTLLTQHGSGATKVQRKIAYGKVAAAWSISVYQSRHTDETRSYRSAYRPLACNHSIAYRWFSGWLCDVEESHRELGRDVAYHSKWCISHERQSQQVSARIGKSTTS